MFNLNNNKKKTKLKQQRDDNILSQIVLLLFKDNSQDLRWTGALPEPYVVMEKKSGATFFDEQFGDNFGTKFLKTSRLLTE